MEIFLAKENRQTTQFLMGHLAVHFTQKTHNSHNDNNYFMIPSPLHSAHTTNYMVYVQCMHVAREQMFEINQVPAYADNSVVWHSPLLYLSRFFVNSHFNDRSCHGFAIISGLARY